MLLIILLSKLRVNDRRLHQTVGRTVASVALSPQQQEKNLLRNHAGKIKFIFPSSSTSKFLFIELLTGRAKGDAACLTNQEMSKINEAVWYGTCN